MRVAAQHERSAAHYRAMINDPIRFLVERGWHGLTDATVEELLGLTDSIVSDTEPLEDKAISLPATSESRIWNRQAPRYSSLQPAPTVIDLVTRERASSVHYLLEQLTANAIRSQGYELGCLKVAAEAQFSCPGFGPHAHPTV